MTFELVHDTPYSSSSLPVGEPENKFFFIPWSNNNDAKIV